MGRFKRRARKGPVAVLAFNLLIARNRNAIFKLIQEADLAHVIENRDFLYTHRRVHVPHISRGGLILVYLRCQVNWFAPTRVRIVKR